MGTRLHALLGLLMLGGAVGIASADVSIPPDPGWAPVADAPYLQESVQQLPTGKPVYAVAVLGDAVYFADDEGVHHLNGDQFEAPRGPAFPVHRLRVLADALWAVGDLGVWRFAEGAWTEAAAGPYVDVCAYLDGVVAATAENLYRLGGEPPVLLNAAPASSPILGVQSYSESLYILQDDQVAFLKGDHFEYDDVKDWGHFPLGAQARGMTALGSRLMVATDKGLGVLRGSSWSALRGSEGLCYEDTTCVAPGFAHDYWVGSTRGAMRAVDGTFQYFGAERWLPNERVNAIAAGKQAVYIATDGGLSILRYEPWTLQKKAAWYKRHLKDWGMIRLGMVTVLSRQADGTTVRNFGDNDIGYTCHYLDALCFEYAVTKDPAVREEAVDIFKTIKWSEEITPIKGYPARSIHAVGEPGNEATTGSAGRPAEWNVTEDGQWVWKGDTSSDEIVAQIYAVSLFHDLVAEGIEKEKAVEHLDRVIGHIVDNDWRLLDLDGAPTVWGQWGPDFVNSPDHTDEHGLNSLQALSFVAVANALFPSEKYERARAQLIEWGYLDNVLRQKITFPHYTRFDDRLAFLSFYPLLRYEQDPAVRGPVMRSLERSWEIKRIEHQSWFNYIYGALTGNDCEAPEAADHLRAYPLDCFGYAYTNSHRSDLQNPPGYTNYLETWRPLTPRDLGWQRWNRSFQQLDGGGSRSVADPSGWLDAYWMGRYYGMIVPPDTSDPALTTVEQGPAATPPAPYAGPARPAIF